MIFLMVATLLITLEGQEVSMQAASKDTYKTLAECQAAIPEAVKQLKEAIAAGTPGAEVKIEAKCQSQHAKH